ncbi:hypothetical protein JCM9152_4593 [Halalkalibacter hemicellulosilyticusJCM 9152]|uniref:Uncharacterized protein n=1 Tax=Halalkalibacter hemicellulosilyticusJCM 9152 TaxID=1236971 RepID=W4QM77_9BACI|nr:hypothetical protein JCM9152_4593 [Halalkalibacter hemicellulosilyticusJCM 9152]
MDPNATIFLKSRQVGAKGQLLFLNQAIFKHILNAHMPKAWYHFDNIFLITVS